MPSFIGDDDEIQHDEASLKAPAEAGTRADLIQTGLSFPWETCTDPFQH